MTEQPTLDALDRKILRALQSSGRTSNQALSEIVNLSPSACLARLRRLEKGGVIAGYHALVRARDLGLALIVIAEVTLSRHNVQDLVRFETAARALDDVVEIIQVSGAYDYLLKVAVTDMARWVDISDSLMTQSLSITKITTLMQLKETKVFSGYPIG